MAEREEKIKLLRTRSQNAKTGKEEGKITRLDSRNQVIEGPH